MKSNLVFYYFISLTLIFCFESNSLGQDKTNISIGFGILELANIGVHYHLKQTQIGLSIGTLPGYDRKILSVLGDLHFHFGEHSLLSSRKPWYFRLGVTYLLEDKVNINNTYFYLTGRFGKEFNLSRKIGMYIDLGVNFEMENNLSNRNEQEGPTGGPYEYPLLPAIGLGMYYKF